LNTTNKILCAIVLVSVMACGLSSQLPVSPVAEMVPTSESLPVIGLVTAKALEVRTEPTEHSPGTGFFLLYGQTKELIGNLLPGTDECPAGWLEIKLGYICAGYVTYPMPAFGR